MKSEAGEKSCGTFVKAGPNPRQSVALYLQPAGLLASPPDRQPSRCIKNSSGRASFAHRVPCPLHRTGGVTAAGPLPLHTGFPIIALRRPVAKFCRAIVFYPFISFQLSTHDCFLMLCIVLQKQRIKEFFRCWVSLRSTQPTLSSYNRVPQ